jgi:hypothetical protein
VEKLIFNEKLYVEELLRIHDITQCDISVFKLIHYLAIYYHQVYGITDKYELAEMINQELQGFNIFEYYYERYYKTIDDIVKNVIKNDIVSLMISVNRKRSNWIYQFYFFSNRHQLKNKNS